jgi:hypothetical protein
MLLLVVVVVLLFLMSPVTSLQRLPSQTTVWAPLLVSLCTRIVPHPCTTFFTPLLQHHWSLSCRAVVLSLTFYGLMLCIWHGKIVSCWAT